jgi:hypothetical protein
MRQAASLATHVFDQDDSGPTYRRWVVPVTSALNLNHPARRLPAVLIPDAQERYSEECR